jgi:hypothetical protein
MESAFAKDFFKQEDEDDKLPPFLRHHLLKRGGGRHIWGFLDTMDLLNLSVSCQALAGAHVSQNTLKELVARDSRIQIFGHMKVSFETHTTLGLLRRMLHRLMRTTETILTIDAHSGRVVLDIGSAFNDKDAFLAQEVKTVPEEEHDILKGVFFLDSHAINDTRIERFLEVASYDEYDDFAPRHPVPKTHRRGNSYFNSDLEGCLRDAHGGAVDMNSLASMALHNLEELNIKTKNMPPLPPKSGAKKKVSLQAAANKNRTLSSVAREALDGSES